MYYVCVLDEGGLLHYYATHTHVSVPTDPMCGGLQAQSNGTVHFSVSPAGYVGTFVCDDGYKLIGNSERLCLCNGQWSGDNPTCEGI